MQNILFELYYGLLSPWDRHPSDFAQHQEINHRIDAEKQRLSQKLDAEDCRRLEELESLYMQSGEKSQLDAFSYGFKLGAQLMMEIYSDESTRPK